MSWVAIVAFEAYSAIYVVVRERIEGLRLIEIYTWMPIGVSEPLFADFDWLTTLVLLRQNRSKELTVVLI